VDRSAKDDTCFKYKTDRFEHHNILTPNKRRVKLNYGRWFFTVAVVKTPDAKKTA